MHIVMSLLKLYIVSTLRQAALKTKRVTLV